jgi:hypothetical protein
MRWVERVAREVAERGGGENATDPAVASRRDPVEGGGGALGSMEDSEFCCSCPGEPLPLSYSETHPAAAAMAKAFPVIF